MTSACMTTPVHYHLYRINGLLVKSTQSIHNLTENVNPGLYLVMAVQGETVRRKLVEIK